MAEFKRIKSELFQGGAKELRAIIEQMRGVPASPVECEFDAKWAHELKERVRAGLAVSFFWAVADMPLEGKVARLRVNGQHSSWGLAELLREGALPDNLAIHLDTYAVADQQGAVLLFRQFDNRKSARQKEDISGAFQCFHEAIRAVKRSVAKLAVEGVAWYRRELQGVAVPSGDDLFELFNEARLHPFIQFLGKLIDDKCPELKRVPIVGACYGTWLDDAKRATDFWTLTALGTKRNVEDAPADLDAELARIREAKEKVKPAELYAKCAKAWGAYLSGSRCTNFKINLKKGLEPIAA